MVSGGTKHQGSGASSSVCIVYFLFFNWCSVVVPSCSELSSVVPVAFCRRAVTEKGLGWLVDLCESMGRGPQAEVSTGIK